MHTHRNLKENFVYKNYSRRWEIVFGQLPSCKKHKMNGFHLYFGGGTLALHRKELEG
jgi:hypothetical protein